MNKTEKYFENQGYSFNREFCGHPEKQIVVRYLGEFVQSHDNMKDAILTAIFHEDERTNRLLV